MSTAYNNYDSNSNSDDDCGDYDQDFNNNHDDADDDATRALPYLRAYRWRITIIIQFM